MTDAGGSEAWAYQVDKPNLRSIHTDQRTNKASPVNITMTVTSYFDLAGNITQLHAPAASGRVINYTYDSADRPSAAIDNTNGFKYATGWQSGAPTGCVATAVCYTPQGSMYGFSFGPTSTFTGFNITNTYNNRLMPLEFKASSTAGNAIDISYNYVDPVKGGNAGHVFSVTNNLNASRTQSFTYDQVNRITSAGTSATSGTYCWGYQYSYDAWGNLLAQAGWAPTYSTCMQGVLPGVTADGNNHISMFAYDASGNATGDGTFTYAWDGESQLKSANGVNYLYDGDGRRVSKSNGKLYWYGPSGEIITETDATGHELNDYIFFAGKHIGTQSSSGVGAFYVEDALGSSRVLTTTGGVVCYDADFTPYGGEQSYTNTCTQNVYKFEGKERDTETGNDDFGARYYSNRFGRWLSSDWSSVAMAIPYANLTNPQTLNLYSMVADDPESFADLDGHENSANGNNECGAQSSAGSNQKSCTSQSNQQSDSAQAGQQKKPDNSAQINVTVAVVKDPQMLENVPTQNGSATGVGAILSYTFTDSNGKPISGASVTETNTVNDNGKIVERSGAVSTNAKGTINDVVMKGGPSASMPGTVETLKAYVTTTPITLQSTQTQTVTTGGKSYQVTSTRTLTNVGANGQLNTNFNSHGVNFTINFTKPVVTATQ
jgi:RHS repeat-associated protein